MSENLCENLFVEFVVGTIGFNVDQNATIEDNLDLNLDDVPDNQFPNVPGTLNYGS